MYIYSSSDCVSGQLDKQAAEDTRSADDTYFDNQASWLTSLFTTLRAADTSSVGVTQPPQPLQPLQPSGAFEGSLPPHPACRLSVGRFVRF